MTDKKKHDTWQKRKDLDLNPYGGVHIHSHNTLKHELAKAVVCYVLSENSREYETEFTLTEDGDRADIVDFGSVDEQPIAVELQTNVSPSVVREKVTIYLDAGLRDVLVLDLNECPNSLQGIYEWVKSELPGVQ